MGSVNNVDEPRSIINVDFTKDGSYNPVNEGPIIISVPFPLIEGNPQFVCVGETVFNPITITNTTSEAATLWSVKIYDSKPKDAFTLSVMEPPSHGSDEEYVRSFVESFSLDHRTLPPAKTLTIWLSCKAVVKGLHTTAIHFNVGDDRIERMGFIMAEDTSNKPYIGPRRNTALVPRVSSAKASNSSVSSVYKYKLPEYPIPMIVRDMIESKMNPHSVTRGLTKENYVAFFTNLLIMEELMLEDEMRSHAMQNVDLKRKDKVLSLQVPGLAERRPSLVSGDFILAKPSSQKEDSMPTLYKGHILHVEGEEVHLSFNAELLSHHSEGDRYDVQFEYNRLGMRRLYHAIEAAGNLDTKFLFPESSPNPRSIEAHPVVPISFKLNEEQFNSVEMILSCRGGPPYVIHGPPGTGKSIVLTEAILQLYTTRTNARMLICAPSDIAADHILEKLVTETDIEIRKGDILRLNAQAHSLDVINSKHLKFCYFDEEENCPIFQHLVRYRIVISTYGSAALLYSEGLKTGHFTHIFLDEAGQASEPETMIPISRFYRRDTVVVLAGDPAQLAPLIFSKDAESYGLGKSYMERLCDSKFYKDGNSSYVTKLVRNYRCHPEILSLPSQLFYKGELFSCKEEVDWNFKDLLPNREFPVLFIGVEERDGNNPSWFNLTEASEVIEVIKDLIWKSVRSEDIGIITPYRQQVVKISSAVVGTGIKVGTVESFQGQEREVIIISYVRSAIKDDERHLSNRRRFNVSVTRARSLLIVIGNPQAICKDEHWKKLLWHCVDNGSYKGCFLPGKEQIADVESDKCICPERGDSTVGYDWAYETPTGPGADSWGEDPTQSPSEADSREGRLDTDWSMEP